MDVSTSSKRGPETTTTEGGGKRAKSGGDNGESSMALPGTGSSPDGDPDTGNPSPENAIIPKPINDFGLHRLVFRKHHSLLSYGLAWKVIRLNATSQHYLTTTSMMSIPVEMPWFYVSPSEWHWLSELRGARVTSVKCKVVMRNPRTAFETNASTTTLATLNQNKFIVTANALNLKTRGIDRALTFGTGTEAMICHDSAEFDKSEQEKFVSAAYGSLSHRPEVNLVGFNSVPMSYCYLPFMLNRYFCNVATHNNINKDIGWPDLTNVVTKQDASFVTGKTVVAYEYSPKFGLLGQPPQMRLNGYYGDTETGVSDDVVCLMSRNRENLGVVYQVNTKTGEHASKSMNTIDVEAEEFESVTKKTKSLYYTPIEKSQYMWNGPHATRGSGHVQPSLHVGVYPVPRLTTNELTVRPVHFTDVEVMWDVECEMTVEYGYSTMGLSHYDKPYLVPYENATFINKLPTGSNAERIYMQNQYSTVDGMYTARQAK